MTWSVMSGEGWMVSGSPSSTDETGGAHAVWRVGTTASAQRALASIETRGATVVAEFVAEAYPGPPAELTLTSDSVLLSAVGEQVALVPGYSDLHGNVADAPSTPVP